MGEEGDQTPKTHDSKIPAPITHTQFLLWKRQKVCFSLCLPLESFNFIVCPFSKTLIVFFVLLNLVTMFDICMNNFRFIEDSFFA